MNGAPVNGRLSDFVFAAPTDTHAVLWRAADHASAAILSLHSKWTVSSCVGVSDRASQPSDQSRRNACLSLHVV